ncbi:MAG: polysaccharide deacetylase family protein [Planctomycetota bacterium]|jgi:predicted glycoside hydrolase/deacetylase ChbG (UPF0249 family)
MPRLLPSTVSALTFCLLAAACLPAADAPPKRYLIIHADDAGMCHSANRATIEAMEKGVVSSASIMVPCAWFPEIAEYAKTHPERDFGVHLTLTSEWKHYRWGPVASRDRVPSLIDDDGFLWRTVAQVAEHVKAEEAEIELRAQIERAGQFGVPITHLDTHMGALVARPDLARLYVKLGLEYDLPILLPRHARERIARQSPQLLGEFDKMLDTLESRGLPVIDYLPTIPAGSDLDARKAIYLHAFKRLEPGVTQIIIHCGCDAPELQAVTARHQSRDLDRRAFTDPDLIAEIGKLGIEVISWKALRKLRSRSQGDSGQREMRDILGVVAQ